MSINKIPVADKKMARQWQKRWTFSNKPNMIYYHVFSPYGAGLDIVPEDVCHDVIERVLNPVAYDGYYTDKNNFDSLLPKDSLPKTIIRKMNGVYMDADYNKIQVDQDNLGGYLDKSGYHRLVVKPTVETCSGNGVIIIEQDRDKWTVLGDNDVFDFNYLQSHYGDDLIVQEALEQSPYIAQFNPTSINTLRLTIYRSVKTNECVAPSAAIRIGRNGALMDNAHQGGGYVGLDREGNLGKKVLDQWGQSCTVFNDIDFANTSFRIPNYDKVVDFAKAIGDCIRHHRLLALDIMIDQNGMPKLIEFNTGTSAAYGMWLFQYAGFSPFGEYTQEIIDYCRDNLTKAKQCITF